GQKKAILNRREENEESATDFWFVTFSSDGNTLAAGGTEKRGISRQEVNMIFYSVESRPRLKMWNLKTEKITVNQGDDQEFVELGPGFRCASFAPDGNTLAVGKYGKMFLT